MRAAVAAGAVSLALAALLTGCSESMPSVAGTPSPSASPSATASAAEPSADATVPAPPASTPEQAAAGPADAPQQEEPAAASPEPQATLNEQEKAYVAAVEGAEQVYPPAVVETGEETCATIRYISEVAGGDAVVAAIKEGEVAEAADAITYLCPEFSDLLQRANQ